MDTSVDMRAPRSLLTIALFIAVVVAVGAVIGINSPPDAWYQSLNKAPWNPPNWVFAPVWFTLYVLIGIAGARTFVRDPSSGAMALWALQMVLNWAWAPAWFSLHQIWLAMGIIIGMLVAVLAFIRANWTLDRIAAWLFVPYALWVAFAGSLNLAVAVLN